MLADEDGIPPWLWSETTRGNSRPLNSARINLQMNGTAAPDSVLWILPNGLDQQICIWNVGLFLRGYGSC